MLASTYTSADIVAILGALVSLVTAVGGVVVMILKANQIHGQVSEVHTLVNSRMTDVQRRVVQLTDALIRQDGNVPDDPADNHPMTS